MKLAYQKPVNTTGTYLHDLHGREFTSSTEFSEEYHPRAPPNSAASMSDTPAPPPVPEIINNLRMNYDSEGVTGGAPPLPIKHSARINGGVHGQRSPSSRPSVPKRSESLGWFGRRRAEKPIRIDDLGYFRVYRSGPDKGKYIYPVGHIFPDGSIALEPIVARYGALTAGHQNNVAGPSRAHAGLSSSHAGPSRYNADAQPNLLAAVSVKFKRYSSSSADGNASTQGLFNFSSSEYLKNVPSLTNDSDSNSNSNSNPSPRSGPALPITSNDFISAFNNNNNINNINNNNSNDNPTPEPQALNRSKSLHKNWAHKKRGQRVPASKIFPARNPYESDGSQSSIPPVPPVPLRHTRTNRGGDKLVGKNTLQEVNSVNRGFGKLVGKDPLQEVNSEAGSIQSLKRLSSGYPELTNMDVQGMESIPPLSFRNGDLMPRREMSSRRPKDRTQPPNTRDHQDRLRIQSGAIPPRNHGILVDSKLSRCNTLTAEDEEKMKPKPLSRSLSLAARPKPKAALLQSPIILGTPSTWHTTDPNIRFMWESAPEDPNPWTATMDIHAKDVPKLMRDGLHWSSSNTDPLASHFVDLPLIPKRMFLKGWMHCRRYTLADKTKKAEDQRWTAVIDVYGRQVSTLADFRLTQLSLDTCSAADAINAQGNMVYYYSAVQPERNFNAIYDYMPLEGWWPWPKATEPKETGFKKAWSGFKAKFRKE